MAAIGGSIIELSINGRVFAPIADVSATMNLGGTSNAVEANGNGTVRVIKTVMPFSIAGMAVESDLARGDQEFLQDLSDSLASFPLAVTFIDGSVYQGTAVIVGELEYSNQTASTTLDMAGQGKLTRQ